MIVYLLLGNQEGFSHWGIFFCCGLSYHVQWVCPKVMSLGDICETPNDNFMNNFKVTVPYLQSTELKSPYRSVAMIM
jgi:hypothetical protein